MEDYKAYLWVMIEHYRYTVIYITCAIAYILYVKECLDRIRQEEENREDE